MTTQTSNSKNLHIDIETYSETDLRACGVYKYVEDPAFEILMLAYAYDDEPVEVLDLKQGDEIPEQLLKALVDPAIVKIAHNANFERTCLTKALDFYMDPAQWYCTAVRASTLGLPRSLAAVGKALGLPEETQKEKQGKALIRYFSVPVTPTRTNGGRTRNLPEHAPEKWQLYLDYCKQDVVAEREVGKRMESYPAISAVEQALWNLDQKIVDGGVLINEKMVLNILDYNAKRQASLEQRAKEITKLDNPGSVSQIKAWLKDAYGMEVESLNKKFLKELLQDKDTPKGLLEFIRIRQELSKTSLSKYDAMARAMCEDNRIRGMLMFYGASRTGRWAGRIVQLQNLPQNKNDNLDLARELVLNYDFEMLELLFKNPTDMLSQMIRTAIIADPEQTFIVADYSAIEARVIAWMADETWRLDVFKTHGKIYEASAAQMFGIPIEQITKDSPYRAKGKVAELALGYQGAVGALKAMGGEAMGLSEKEMRSIVDSWRNANPKIVKLWYNVEEQAKKAIQNPGSVIEGPKGIRYKMIKDILFIKLPSGRNLAYPGAKVNTSDQIIYMGEDSTTHKWGQVETYGGKLVENLIQATARDCLAWAMLELEKAGYVPKFHVHDEVVISVPKDEREMHQKRIEALMAKEQPWQKGLVLTADSYATEYYMKD
jgi:DNA polymerase